MRGIIVAGAILNTLVVVDAETWLITDYDVANMQLIDDGDDDGSAWQGIDAEHGAADQSISSPEQLKEGILAFAQSDECVQYTLLDGQWSESYCRDDAGYMELINSQDYNAFLRSA